MPSRLKHLFTGFSIKTAGLALLSGTLMAIACPPHDGWWLMLIGLVPFFVALEGLGTKGAYWVSVLTGAALVCIGFSWLPGTVETFWRMPLSVGYLFTLIFSLFAGQALALVTLLVRWLTQRNTWMPEAFIWAFIFVSVWSLYPMVLHFSLSNAFHTAPYTLQGLPFLAAKRWTSPLF